MKAFEIKKDDVEILNQFSFTELMHKLLRAELSKIKLKQSELVVSLDINDPDGGLDGYIGTGIPNYHPWLPSGKSGWQFKAVKDFSSSKAVDEVLLEDKTDLKPRIKKLLENGETYVLAIGRKDYGITQLEEREDKIIETFKNKGFADGKAKVYSSGQIAEWINTIPSLICHLNPNRANFKDIEEWKKSSIIIKEPKDFVPDAKRENILQSIRKAIISNQTRDKATIIRLVGLSGIGKTRLIYEALNIEELKNLVFYVESPEKLPTSRFNEISLNEAIIAIFVVDECSNHKYVELAKEVEGIGGRITLITLDYDIDKSRAPEDIHIVLEKLDSNALDKLIQITIPSLPEMARRKIVDFSEGYPRIAVLLSEHFSSHPEILSPDTLSELAIDDLFDKMIEGRNTELSEKGNIKNILTMIALFRRLGWDGELSAQGRKVCEFFKIDWLKARSLIHTQEERGLVIKRGRYRYISPLPLAIYLASSWWEAMDESTWQEFLETLPDLESKKAFFDRLSDLSYSKQANIALKKNFLKYDYKFLDSETGSEIFLSLAKADHLLAIETLERILENLSREELLEFHLGRRNVVWALEKIAWWQDSFHRAARLLMKLAAAENETWSNNATGVFSHLFQTILGGTAVPAWERHCILEESLNSGDRTLQKLGLKGLRATFNLMHAVRDVSGEEQGAIIPPSEWNPKSPEDLRKSVLSALNIMDKALQISDYEIQKEANNIFLTKIRILLGRGFYDVVIEKLEQIRVKFPGLEKELIKSVEEVIYFNGKRLPNEVVTNMINFREKLIGDDFKGLMKRYVKSKLLEDYLEDNKVKAEKIIEDLAEEGIRYPEKLKGEINWLVTHEAENGYQFGKILGDLDKDYYWLDVIIQSLKDSENPSAYFFGGYLASIKLRDENLWEKIIFMCYDDETFKKFILEIIWRSGISDNAVRLIIRSLKDTAIQPRDLELLAYGAWFSKASEKIFIEFLEEFYKIENGKYSPLILGIINQYLETHPDIIVHTKNILLKYLTKPEIFEKPDTMTLFYWDMLTTKLIDRFNDTLPHILDLILSVLMDKNFVYFGSDFRKKVKYFLEKDFDKTWSKLRKALIAYDKLAWNLTQILRGDYSDFRKEKNSLLGLIPDAYIWEWVEEYADKAPYILASMIPLHENEPHLHPLARNLLIRYPSDGDVASELSANWHTEGWAGSTSLLYENKLHIAEKWAEDSEPSVASWAKTEIERLEKQLETSRREEEERGF